MYHYSFLALWYRKIVSWTVDLFGGGKGWSPIYIYNVSFNAIQDTHRYKSKGTLADIPFLSLLTKISMKFVWSFNPRECACTNRKWTQFARARLTKAPEEVHVSPGPDRMPFSKEIPLPSSFDLRYHDCRHWLARRLLTCRGHSIITTSTTLRGHNKSYELCEPWPYAIVRWILFWRGLPLRYFPSFCLRYFPSHRLFRSKVFSCTRLILKPWHIYYANICRWYCQSGDCHPISETLCSVVSPRP